ncbi:substrate-binding domain-containing protein [Brachyspira hyodysenteriae]|uniref:PstS family phosphate ABC transporter substrate-binding protein n=1 Tax=Brachyspira hyodysenteriae TaxID=159 RepID=UPI00118287B1|nr:substrate-binding domain-containing protein [Brachyspira hyodysenteriae]MCZ9839760.1 substrate-binding domain-containing protein [Brachyspira hyodysenteriae]MCZ9847403.1 substrate-binding domain-containing protein [Brachyspira hyodysenteriae]MCZ9851012.1 substrate-binding domain-containing protein [Brachyspira hyodysenteriae]MCZ9860236.1 substrate-binding domain-containing protein [Brachyspira hyodysenteriae]MCZ9873103.1 substrate-binding domain-containing protein [Brachyspira hyodysenteria
MNIKTSINALAIIFIPISILFILISLIMMIISDSSIITFYLMILASIVLIINSIMLFIKNNYKIFIIIFSLTFVFSLIIIFSNIMFIYNNRDANFKEVNNYVIADSYYPFADIRNTNSKVVKLTNESSLIITNNFPRLDGEIEFFPIYSAFADAVYKITVTNNKYTNMFLKQVPFEEYIIINDNGRIETNYDRATNSSHDTAYVLCSTIYYNTYESFLYDNAYKNLINGKVDIVFGNAPSNKDIEMAKTNNIDFILIPIGKEAFVFFVNSKNKVDNLSKENIKDIYIGKINNWKEVGGDNIKIKAHQMDNIGKWQITFTNFMASMNAENNIIKPDTKIGFDLNSGFTENVKEYRNRKNAIGYSFLFNIHEMIKNNEIKTLSIDNIKPNKENIQNGSYTLSSTFYATTTKRALEENPNVQKLIDFILSEQGQYLVEKAGYTPIK